MYKRILCPIDGSSTSTRGMAEAVRLAKDQGASLRFVHVIDAFYLIVDPSGAAGLAEYLASLHEYGIRVLDEAKRKADASGIDVETKLLETTSVGIAPLLVEEARNWPADLIVMGTHGRRGMSHLVMGSDAEGVVRTSPVPVLLVRGEEAPRP